MEFVDTRSGEILPLDWLAAIRVGKAGDGLIAPRELPAAFSESELSSLKNLSFAELSTKIISRFFGVAESEIRPLSAAAYASENWDDERIVPIVKSGEFWYAEQWYGRTAAFKDIALSWLPQAMKLALENSDFEKIAIVGATSGDTGSAGEAGFAEVRDVSVSVLFPTIGRVSEIQQRQMLGLQTADGRIAALPIAANFDFCQNEIVKPILGDREFRDELRRGFSAELTSLNSINIGRLVPQLTTFFAAWQTVGEEFDVAVPSGNFGHALSAFFAKKLGCPIAKIILASNRNDALDKFFRSGRLEISDFQPTNSPSMDITIPSNLERLLYFFGGAELTKEIYEILSKKGFYEVSSDFLAEIQRDFVSGKADDAETLVEIRQVRENQKRLLDPHTAVANRVARELKNSRPVVVLETAHPAKFAATVADAIGFSPAEDEVETMKNLAEFVESEGSLPRLPKFLATLSGEISLPSEGMSITPEEMKNRIRGQLAD